MRRIENQQSHSGQGITREKDTGIQISRRRTERTLERRVLFFREVPRHIETRTGPDPGPHPVTGRR